MKRSYLILQTLSTATKVKPQHGFTLVEVLIAVLVLSIGLLGIAGVQLVGLKYNDSSYLRTQASLYAYDIMDRMRANRAAAVAGDYNRALSAFASLAVPGAGASIAQVDNYDWYRKINELPTASGAIGCTAAATCTVTVQWNDARAENANAPVLMQVVVAGQL